MLKKCSKSLGSSAVRCPNLSEKVLGSRAERRAEPIFGQLDNSARLGFRSDKPKILDLGSAVGRTEEEILSECPPLHGHHEPNQAPAEAATSILIILLIINYYLIQYIYLYRC